MTNLNFLLKNRDVIQRTVHELIEQQRSETAINPTANLVFDKLLSFMEHGKYLRGSLVLLSVEMYKGDKTSAVKLASCIEIIHAALLIHDDIMDNDRLRRGHLSIYSQFEKRAKQEKYRYPKAYAQSMAICVGDIAFFLALKIIHELSCPSEIKNNIISFLSKELLFVGFAQMQEYEYSCVTGIPSENDILSLYRYKTARYSFVLPLITGALLSGKRLDELKDIEKMAEDYGILFQIKDDEIGIFSIDSVSGKPQGSDIREGKKTILYRQLFTLANKQQRIILNSIFGSKKVTKENLQTVKEMISELNIHSYTNNLIKSLSVSIHNSIEQLKIERQYKQQFKYLLDYSIQRDK